MIDVIRLRLIKMREQQDLPEPYGDLEDKVARIKADIALMNDRLGRNYHARKAELSHNAKPSLSLSERLAANPSFRNAVRT